MKNDKQQKVTSYPFTRRSFLSTSLKVGAAAFTTGLLPKLRTNADCQYNVLFIIADDLRPLLGCYGHSEMYTPNIDRLAQRGTLLNRAYCHYPKCNPSRVSMLTGLRPETTRVLDNTDDLREMQPDAVTLPQYFKTYGYHTQSIGKVAHKPEMQDDTYSWSVPSWTRTIKYDRPSVPSWQALDVEDDELIDGEIAARTLQVLQEIQSKQFFLAVGFHRPHLPFYAPKKYFELYNDINFSLPNVSTVVDAKLGGISNYQDIPDSGPLSNAQILELIRAYAASVSFIDAQVGRILERLETLSLTKNTVIVFAGDHGFHLGEQGKWGKGTLFEVSLRSPLIVSIPGQTHQGVKTDALTELVDIYPTLCDACQLPIPSQLEGLSLIPLIDEPKRTWKTAAFSQNVGSIANSIRTEQYRYSEWAYNGLYEQELYDYYADPNETVNIAHLPENNELVAQLSEQLAAGWQAALPDMSDTTTIPETLPLDINNDGIVDIQDLLVIAGSFGADSPENPKVDVNKDGSVDIIDLLIVAAHFSETTNPAAPTTHRNTNSKHLSQIEKWLTQAHLADDGTKVFKQGIAALETLLEIAIPEKTALLPNYPNPFNPETWIPYDLGTDANVKIDIYNMKGQRVRQLAMGNQVAGTYRTQSSAAYWDGRNSTGEPVASGVYIFTLQAGKFKATRRMMIVK